MDFQNLGRILLLVGGVIVIIGGLFLLIGRVPFLNRLGNLPGDIRIETGSFTCMMPIVSMILISVVLTIVVNIILRIINRP